MEIEIKRAIEADSSYIKEKLEKYILDGTNADWQDFFVARFKDTTVAFGRIIDHEDYFEIASLGVDYYHRKKGIGKKLLSFLVGEAKRENSLKPIYVVTHRPAFFEKYGFKEVNPGPEILERKKREKCRVKPEQSRIMRLTS